MSEIQDERGFNQIFKKTLSATIRKKRRCDYMISEMNVQTLNSSTNILEIGCGTGEAIAYIAEKTGATCLGVDLSRIFIEEASKNYTRGNLLFEVADFNDVGSFKGELAFHKFDYIVGNGILHHLYYNIDNTLINLRNLLKENGKIIFIEPNIYNPYVALIFKIPFLRRKAFLEPDEMAFSAKFIKRKLVHAKFSSCKVKIKDFLLPNIPDKLINPVIKIGNILEKTPFTYIAQSIFITATNSNQNNL